ncbi:4-hydroxybenzoate octaprenyltransferase [Kushneria marisflavi]|uniref:4-hydroxybenzoate octaprenyltransferase n=1 Tax=Kushneria marisflavi TaxID=157779 RepID=A0A240UQD8_9GAMM|nr:4-hydroxybenzoate octaprenyltransferase [Kushneria marisflavi]ART63240.1 4-hydroxybenzoate polyprenyltransferase [Kushneria marisflavi]RKD84270.1 4-hydroxybenzoate polyprenyltransferase [Kushneria marisflavi]
MPSPLARLPDFMRLTRLDRPIGTWLLMWPTLAALWLAGDGLPTRHNLIIFILGVYVMRAAGCVINDYADRHFDAHVKRTHDRPLATGRISEREALTLFGVLLAIAFVLVCFTNAYTIMLSFGAAALAASYPFMKRYTHLPQVVLGAAFGWSIPMAFGAEQGHVPAVAWWLFFANIVWTLVYDTWYAMVDRDDDLKIGIKSTAVLFGRMDLVIQGALQVLMLMLLAVVGRLEELDGFYWASLAAIAVVFVHQQRLCRTRTREGCFQAFLNNHWVGILLFAGIALATWQA